MTNLLPLWDVQAQYDAELQAKIQRFLGQWLPEVERLLDEKGLEANMFVIFEEPYTPGGVFAHVPKAIVTAKVTHLGAYWPSDEPRRGMALGIQRMQSYPDPASAIPRLVRDLTYAARPESYFFPKP